VQQRWNEGCHNIQQLWREIKARGYPHSASALRKQLGAQQGKKKESLSPASSLDHLEAKTAVWLFIRPITDLDRSEQAELETLRQASETVETIYQLVQEFLRMVRKRKGLQLENWLAKVRASPIPELHREALGIERDKSAVLAGLILSYNNGHLVRPSHQD
jgi:transposase